MKAVSVTLLASSVAAVRGDASARWAGLRRRLSLEKIAGYSPGSKVTDQCAIDLDQRDIEAQLAKRTPESFEVAKTIYQQGGHSESYAQVTLTEPLENNLRGDTPIMGENADGEDVSGEAYEDYTNGESVIKVRYSTTNLQKSYVGCQVGGLPEADRMTRGCFKGPTGVLKIGDKQYAYTYDPVTDNNNGRTISGFSVRAGEQMRYGEDTSGGFKMQGSSMGEDGIPILNEGCTGCPYEDHSYFYDYYGSDTYADDWILAAFQGKRTKFDNGNADFSLYGFEGREEAIKKGTAYMSIFMYVIRELEKALDDCEIECTDCNDDSVHGWDEGVCYYTGSIEGQDGILDGTLLYQLADDHCEDFHNCGVQGTERSGTSKVNYDLFDLFALGNYQLVTGNCPGARATAKRIISKMYVPLIQGALRHAWEMDGLRGGETEMAAGASFAAAVLPRVHAASPARAGVIYENLGVGADETRFGEVKHAFESVYADMGITCDDVGGLWNPLGNEGKGGYYKGAEKCVTKVEATKSEEIAEESNRVVIAVGATLGGLFVMAAGMVLYMRSREIEGDPVFKGPDDDIKSIN